MIFVEVISITESNRTQSNGLSSIGFDVFDLVRLELVRLPSSIELNTDLHSID